MKLKTRRDFVKLRTGPTVHALLSWHVHMLRMETCACLINYQECTLWVPLQNLSAENYAIKKPQGMRAVCSPCPTSVPVLQFQRKSQTICAQRGRGCVKKNKTGGEKGGGKTVSSGKCFLNFGALVQCCSHTAVAHGIGRIWARAHARSTVRGHRGRTVLPCLIQKRKVTDGTEAVQSEQRTETGGVVDVSAPSSWLICVTELLVNKEAYRRQRVSNEGQSSVDICLCRWHIYDGRGQLYAARMTEDQACARRNQTEVTPEADFH